MKKVMIALALFPSAILFAQKKDAEVRIPMTPEKWESKAGTVSFAEFKSKQAIQLLTPNNMAIVKGLDFSSGTIEFDWAPDGPFFASMFFRMKDTLERECFYLRTHVEDVPNAMQAVQYAPFIAGVNLWDLLPHYQGPAAFKKKEWNHVKLVISGERMLAYVNDMQRPALVVPQLHGNTGSGSIAFEGAAKIANLVVKPGQTESLSPKAETDPVYNDPRYLRSWQITSPKPLPYGQEAYFVKAPELKEEWKTVTAERLGIVNITRLYGMSKERRMVWLKLKMKSPKAQIRKLDLGFNDEIWMYLNGRLLYSDKNLFGMPAGKQPLGRMSLENSQISLPLEQGENELLIALANDFYGWGLVMRIDNLEGIEVLP